MIDVRQLLVVERGEAVGAEVGYGEAEELFYLCVAASRREDEAAVSESLMREEMQLFAAVSRDNRFVGGQQRDGCASLVEEDERVVAETVAVIVHIAAEEEECGVARRGDEGVPQGLVSRRISL